MGKYKQVLIVYVISSILFTIGLESFMLYMYVYVSGTLDYVWPVLVSVGIPGMFLGLNLSRQLANMTAPKKSQASQHYNRTIPFRANNKDGHLFMNVVSSIFTSQPSDEFVFWVKGMNWSVSETRLYLFCKRAWRRQTQADMGMLHGNKILSHKYFKTEFRHDYQSIIIVLSKCNLIEGRWIGKTGRLKYSPGITTEEAKNRW